MAQLSIHQERLSISQVAGFAVGAAGTLPPPADDIYPHKGKTDSWHVV